MRKPSLSLLLAVVVLLTSVALTACHRSRGATEARVPATEPGDPTVPPSASAANRLRQRTTNSASRSAMTS